MKRLFTVMLLVFGTIVSICAQETEHYHNGNAYSGKFYVETYCGNDRLDFCNLTFRPGFVTKYETGR